MREVIPKTPETVIEKDLSLVYDYSRVTESVASLVEGYGTANQVYCELGRIGLIKASFSKSPNSYELLTSSVEQVQSDPGVVVLKNTAVDSVPNEQAQLLSIALGSIYGEPTKTDRKVKQIAWPIRYDPDTSVKRTFSQSLGEAAYHTDTQYFEKPEDYFGLFCINSDIKGKGTSQVVHLDSILSSLREEYGDECIEELTKPYPFKVPSVFTATGTDEDIEILWAPILNSGLSEIRYRKDTIGDALAVSGIEFDETQHEALRDLDKVLDEIEPISYHLEPGDGILINNLKLLHARTAFDNPDRFLYRVRMRASDAV